MSEGQKEEKIKKLLSENITDKITEELLTLDIQDSSLIEKVLFELGSNNDITASTTQNQKITSLSTAP